VCVCACARGRSCAYLLARTYFLANKFSGCGGCSIEHLVDIGDVSTCVTAQYILQIEWTVWNTYA
jgi:hypothetical protein